MGIFRGLVLIIRTYTAGGGCSVDASQVLLLLLLEDGRLRGLLRLLSCETGEVVIRA